MDLDAFLTLSRSRRAVRHFTDDPVADEVLAHILDAARWAPSGYNLQPVHFWVVRRAESKVALRKACFGQGQVVEAPVVLVLGADRQAWRANLSRVIEMDLEAGAINHEYARKIRQFVYLGFRTGPIGIGWLLKAVVRPVARCFTPMPAFPSQNMREWLTRQAALSGMSLMLAAKAAGLDTCPMEGFDEGRVRRVVGIPRRFIIPLIIPLGRSTQPSLTKTRLPLESMVHSVD